MNIYIDIYHSYLPFFVSDLSRYSVNTQIIKHCEIGVWCHLICTNMIETFYHANDCICYLKSLSLYIFRKEFISIPFLGARSCPRPES